MCVRVCVCAVCAFEYEHGTSDFGDAVSFVELSADVEAFPSQSHYASLSPHLTHDSALQHCLTAGSGLSLCKAKALCPGEQPIGGVRPHRAMVPVSGHDGSSNAWVSISSERTCEEQSGGQWGKQAVYKSYKGLVACCDANGAVVPTALSQWEGFLVKSSELNAVFMVEGGTRRAVPSAKSFLAQGFHFQRIKLLSTEDLRAIPLGLALPDLSDKPKNSVPFEHALLGFNHDGGSPFEAFEGHLIKKAGNAIVCMVERGSKRCVPDFETFEALAFEYRLVQNVAPELYDAFPEGEGFSSLRGAAPGSSPYVHPLLAKEHFGTASLRSTAVKPAAFVQSAVRRLLQREATAQELAHYAPQLESKRDVPALVLKLASSASYQSAHLYPLVAAALYRQLLERDATAEESAAIIAQLQRAKASHDPTKTVKQIVSQLLLSPEHVDAFLAKDGVAPSQALAVLYRHAMGRAPSEAELAQGLELQGKKGWTGVIAALLASNDYRATAGAHGVPGAPSLYAPAVVTLFKQLLNVDASAALPASALVAESGEVARHGWEAFVADFIRRKEYIAENGNNGFIDETDRTMTLA